MAGHELRAEFVQDKVHASCTCGAWKGTRLAAGSRGWLARAHGEHVRHCEAAGRAQLEAEQIGQARAWYERTGHCAECGQPGEFCLCTKPCRCAGLHETGSGVGRDPTLVFACDVIDQDALW